MHDNQPEINKQHTYLENAEKHNFQSNCWPRYMVHFLAHPNTSHSAPEFLMEEEKIIEKKRKEGKLDGIPLSCTQILFERKIDDKKKKYLKIFKGLGDLQSFPK